MQYIYYAITPPKTLASAPRLTTCALTYGIITDILFVYPKGCYGLVGLQILDHSELIFPANQNNWLTGDGLTQSFIEGIDLTNSDPTLVIQTYNTDDTYTHTIEVVFTIQPPTATSAPAGGGVSESQGSGDITPLPEPTPTPTPTPPAPTPIVCPTGYTLVNGVCVKNAPTPPTPPKPTPTTKFNISLAGVMF